MSCAFCTTSTLLPLNKRDEFYRTGDIVRPTTDGNFVVTNAPPIELTAADKRAKPMKRHICS